MSAVIWEGEYTPVVQANVVMVSPSCVLCQPVSPHVRQLDALATYAFYFAKVLPSREIAEQGIFAQARGQYPSIFTECDAAGGIDGLNDFAWIESGLDFGLVGHVWRFSLPWNNKTGAVRLCVEAR